ncbi:D-hexose-6-phosphate mutarotase, partial [Cutibacterium acnes subsp. acnes]|nr:D-hexose-6-phosphate mutarotase [Cutibacterium acnes subsp. acnes]
CKDNAVIVAPHSDLTMSTRISVETL